MRILISGASGLVGSALAPALKQDGHEVWRLVRGQADVAKGECFWDPAREVLEWPLNASPEAVIHLAGDNVASGRWTLGKKQQIRESRSRGTRLLCERMAAAPNPPRTLISASAVGIYGDRSAELLEEVSSPGEGFLAGVTREWEEATESAARRGIRVVCLRFGMILSARGGALKKMLPAFRVGGGAILGSGNQYVSWVGEEDAVRAIQFCLDRSDLSGPVNVVAPGSVTNREFSEALGAVLKRPVLLRLPGLLLKFMFGGMASEVLLASARVYPGKLLQAGFEFQQPALKDALVSVLGRGES